MARKGAGESRPSFIPHRVPTCVECHVVGVEIHDCVVRMRSSGSPLRQTLCVECMALFDVLDDYGEAV